MTAEVTEETAPEALAETPTEAPAEMPSTPEVVSVASPLPAAPVGGLPGYWLAKRLARSLG